MSKRCNAAFQPRRFTTYGRDYNGTDEAMFRRYNRWHARFDQPDPYEGSYDQTDPQSFNRYAYVQGDPVNFTDPSGLDIGTVGNPEPHSPPVSLFDDYFINSWKNGWNMLYGLNPLTFTFETGHGRTEKYSWVEYTTTTLTQHPSNQMINRLPGVDFQQRTILNLKMRAAVRRDAWNEYSSCVNNSAGAKEFQKRVSEVPMFEPPILGLGFTAINAARHGLHGLSAAKIMSGAAGEFVGGLPFEFLLDNIRYSGEVAHLKEKYLDPVLKECGDKVRAKYGFVPTGP